MKAFAAVLLAALTVAAPVPAFAETPEEAVAYAFFGLADGATLSRATTTMNWKAASASPAIFDGDAKIGARSAHIRFTVTAVDACHYDVILEGPMVPGGKAALYAKVDLSQVTGVTIAADALRAEVAGSGFCETGRTNRACMAVGRSDLFGFVDAKRHAAAIAFIRDEVCPAKAE